MSNRHERGQTITKIQDPTGRIKSAPGGATNTLRGLTRSSGTSREGLGMKPTRSDRRHMNADPHPELAEAVTISRFWRLVDEDEPSKCWHWQGDTNRDGYGVFFFRGRRYGAHELALSFTTGELRLSGLDTCHACDNPPCCNPAHLRFDTRRSNVADMVERGRAAAPHRKLTDEEIVTIRERRAMGARQKDLAEHFGVTDGQISMIVRGLRWSHVGGPIQTERQYNRG